MILELMTTDYDFRERNAGTHYGVRMPSCRAQAQREVSDFCGDRA